MVKIDLSEHTSINDQGITQLTSKNGKLSHVMHLERKIDDNICVFHKEISTASIKREHHQMHKARARTRRRSETIRNAH